jgi:hypothetical protein
VGVGNNIMLTNEHKKVSIDVLVGDCIGSPSKPMIDSVCYLLVVDVSGLLCDAKHVKYLTRSCLTLGYGHQQSSQIRFQWLVSFNKS